jgi:hypothetical protein
VERKLEIVNIKRARLKIRTRKQIEKAELQVSLASPPSRC